MYVQSKYNRMDNNTSGDSPIKDARDKPILTMLEMIRRQVIPILTMLVVKLHLDFIEGLFFHPGW